MIFIMFIYDLDAAIITGSYPSNKLAAYSPRKRSIRTTKFPQGLPVEGPAETKNPD
jgi:hypothetical protein